MGSHWFERWAKRATVAGVLFACACSSRQNGLGSGDFGTLPEVSVPIEKQPAQDPTLFRDKKPPRSTLTVSDPPDPTPLRSKDHYDFALEFNKGEVRVLSVTPVRLSQPASTPRRLGRFALELWTGEQLIERVRFDFPLLGATDENEPDPLGKGLVSQAKVRVPASARARRAHVLDRKTREMIEIPWPPGTSEANHADDSSAASPLHCEKTGHGGDCRPVLSGNDEL